MLQDIYNYLELNDKISTAGQPTEAQLVDVAAAGYQTVINLAMHDDSYSLANERGAVEGLGMEYIHIPVIWQNPTPDNFRAFCEAIEAHQGQKVFVHCAANMRVSAFMALYRITQQGISQEDAFRDLHRIWSPDGLWKDFMEQVLSQGAKSA